MVLMIARHRQYLIVRILELGIDDLLPIVTEAVGNLLFARMGVGDVAEEDELHRRAAETIQLLRDQLRHRYGARLERIALHDIAHCKNYSQRLSSWASARAIPLATIAETAMVKIAERPYFISYLLGNKLAEAD